MHVNATIKKVKGPVWLEMEPHLTATGSLAIRDHRHKWTHPALTPARQNGTRFTYPRGMEGWVDLCDQLHTKMVYLPTDSHPSKY